MSPNTGVEQSAPHRAARRFVDALRERYGDDGLVDVRMFGSCACGEMREDSDIDTAG